MLKFLKIFTNNFAIKFISLVMALVTWYFVFSEIRREKTLRDSTNVSMLPFFERLTTKQLNVKAVFIGNVPEGYELLKDTVQIEPSNFIIAGPKSVLSKLENLQTEPIEINRYKKSTAVSAKINPIAPNIDTDSLIVKVTIPVRKIEEVKVIEEQKSAGEVKK